MDWNLKAANKIMSPTEAARSAYLFQFKSKKVVFTNGCFDILHRGHVDYLQSARSLGDYLVVGLNTDDSVKRLGKGEDRPINSQDARAAVLSGLACVDAVVLFNEDTPMELIQVIRPDVLVKGGDYKIDSVVGADFVMSLGGKVEIIPLTEGFSTSKTLEKIKKG